jgi:hypothetical protein
MIGCFHVYYIFFCFFMTYLLIIDNYKMRNLQPLPIEVLGPLLRPGVKPNKASFFSSD